MLGVVARVRLVRGEEGDQGHFGGKVDVDLDLAPPLTQEARPGTPGLIMSGLPVDRLRSRQLKVAPARDPEPGCRRFDRSQDQLRIDPELRTQLREPLME